MVIVIPVTIGGVLIIIVIVVVKRKKRREVNKTQTELKKEEETEKDYNPSSTPVDGGFLVKSPDPDRGSMVGVLFI